MFLTNKAFHAKVGCHPGALQFLGIVGFKHDETEVTMTLAPGREDTALLWLAKGLLEAQRDTVEYGRAKEMSQL